MVTKRLNSVSPFVLSNHRLPSRENFLREFNGWIRQPLLTINPDWFSSICHSRTLFFHWRSFLWETFIKVANLCHSRFRWRFHVHHRISYFLFYERWMCFLYCSKKWVNIMRLYSRRVIESRYSIVWLSRTYCLMLMNCDWMRCCKYDYSDCPWNSYNLISRIKGHFFKNETGNEYSFFH